MEPIKLQSNKNHNDITITAMQKKRCKPLVSRYHEQVWFLIMSALPCEKQSRIKRPRNAFIIYRMEHLQSLKIEMPELSNTELSKVLGKRWREEVEVNRQHYFEKARAEKATHQLEHPDYKFIRRKPQTIIRRKTTSDAQIDWLSLSAKYREN
jgi:hypothetical protein